MSGVRWNKAVHKGRRVGAAAAVAAVEGGRRKERRLSLAVATFSFKGTGPSPLLFRPPFPSLDQTRPVSWNAKARKTARRSFHELFYPNFFSLSSLFLCLSSPPPPLSLSSRVFCYLFFCLTFAYKDVCIVEVAPLQGWGSKEWFTLDVLFIFMEVGSLQIVTGYSCLSFVYNTIVIFKMYHEYLLLWGGLVFKLVQCSRASYCFQLEKIALSLVA